MQTGQGKRRRLLDVLQDHFFWAFDASGGVFRTPVFNPLFGFSRISAPEISLDVESFKDGTFLHERHVAKGGTVSPVVFERGASLEDSDFYDWIRLALYGEEEWSLSSKATGWAAGKLGVSADSSPRKNILVVQFTTWNLAGGGNTERKRSPNNTVGASSSFSLADASVILTALGATGYGAAAAAAVGAGALGVGPFQFAMRVPARAWVLRDCIPVRYRAGSDFDASSGQVSIQELEVQPEYIEEFSLGGAI